MLTSVSKVQKALPAAIVVLVALNTLIAILRLGHNVPIGDDWSLVEDIRRWHAGTLDATFLLRQHNEHRLLFPRLYMLLIVQLSSWDLRHLMLSSLAAAGVVYALFCGALVRAQRQSERERQAPECALLGVFVFSIGQYQNWLWGWQITMLMNVLAVIAGFYVLSVPARSTWTLLTAAAAGVIATFSFANGVLFWPISLLFFIGGRPRMSHLAGWLALMSACLTLYLWGYQKPLQHPDLLFGARHPLQVVVYVLTFIGGPLIYSNAATKLLSGLVGLTFGGYLARRLVAHRDALQDRQLQFWLACGGYALASAAITAWGRAGLGAIQAAESRYVTIANLYWAMLIGITSWMMRRDLLRPGRALRIGFVTVVVCVGFATVASTVSLHRTWPAATLARAAEELRKETCDPAIVRTISKDVPLAERGRRYLNEHGLSYAAR